MMEKENSSNWCRALGCGQNPIGVKILGATLVDVVLMESMESVDGSGGKTENRLPERTGKLT
jgi:hypothetical protein